MDKRTERYTWLDALRGLAALFVMIGHQIHQYRQFFVFTSPIKVPLFFCISGYLFNDEHGDVKRFMTKLAKRIILPWLILALVPAICIAWFRGFEYLISAVKDIIFGHRTWYCPCFIIALTISFFQHKFLKKRSLIILSSVMMTIAGLLLAKGHILDTLFINNAMIAQAFLLLGKLLKQYQERLNKWPVKYIVLICVLYVLLGIGSTILFPGQTMDVHLNRYYNIFICFAMILLGNIVLFYASPRIMGGWEPLVYIGQNSLLFFLWGDYIVAIAHRVMNIVHVQLHPIPDMIVCTIVACVVCGAGAFFLNRFFPFANGKRRVRK